VQSARRVPFRLRDKIGCALDNMESSGTITKVKQPTGWVQPTVNVLKPEGSLCVCLDPTELNKCIKREHFLLPNKAFREVFVKSVLENPSMNILKSYIANGWPRTKHMCLEPLKPYWNVRHDLSIHDEIILKGSKQILVPTSLRKRIINDIHKGHLGVTKCIEKANNAVSWPGYTNQITDAVDSCEVCHENASANAKTILEQYEIPEYAMQSISIDIFQLEGVEYLVTVDSRVGVNYM